MVEVTTDTKNPNYDGRARNDHRAIKVYKAGDRFLMSEHMERFKEDAPLQTVRSLRKLGGYYEFVRPSYWDLEKVLREVEPIGYRERLYVAGVDSDNIAIHDLLDMLTDWKQQR